MLLGMNAPLKTALKLKVTLLRISCNIPSKIQKQKDSWQQETDLRTAGVVQCDPGATLWRVNKKPEERLWRSLVVETTLGTLDLHAMDYI